MAEGIDAIRSTEDIQFIDKPPEPEIIHLPSTTSETRDEATEDIKKRLDVAIEKKYREAAEFLFNQLLERNLPQEQLLIYKNQIESIPVKRHHKPPETDAQKQKKKYQPQLEKSTVKFANIIGFQDIKTKLRQEMELFLKRKDEATSMGIKPTGIILYSAPGLGKSLFAYGIAGEANIPILAPSLHQMFDEFVGNSEKILDDLFNTAKKNAPCVLFFDEVDVLAKRRGDIEARGESAINKNMVTQLLTELQKLHDANVSVIPISATNEIWSIDDAVKRPGRFGETIYVRSPRIRERTKLFAYYLKEITILCKNCNHPLVKEKKAYRHSNLHGHKCLLKSCTYEKCIKPEYGINYRHISPFGFLRLSIATTGYSASDIAEICNRAKKDFLLNNYKYLSTGKIIHIIKSKQFRISSIDPWFINSYKDLLGETKVTKRKVGLIKTIKEKVTTDGKFSADQKQIYREMVDDIKWRKKAGMWIFMVRAFARF